jgi:uncharacterized protein (TIRG00374 family)
MLILLVSHYVRALRWNMIIRSMGYHPRQTVVFLTVMIGFFFNLLFPRLGEVLKCTYLGKQEKIPVDKLIGTMVAERIVDLLCLVLVIAITVFSQLDLIGGYSEEMMQAIRLKLDFGPLAWAVSILILSIIIILIYRYLYKATSSDKKTGIAKFIKGIIQGFSAIRKLDKPQIFIFHTILIWFLYLSSIRVGFWAMEETLSLGWAPSFTILTFGSFAMIVTQGGIGAYQLAVQKTLTFYGISEVSGLAFGWLLWSVQTLMLLVTGPIALAILMRKTVTSTKS